MTDYAPFPDVEVALMVYLDDLGEGWTFTPADLNDRLHTRPLLRIQRIGGGNTKQSDEPRVSIQAFTLRDPASPRSSHKLSATIEARLLSGPALVTIPTEYGGGTARLDTAETESGPVEFPWPDPAIRVVQCVYRLSVRR